MHLIYQSFATILFLFCKCINCKVSTCINCKIFSPCTIRWLIIRTVARKCYSHCYCGGSYMKKTCFIPLMKYIMKSKIDVANELVKAQLTLPISNLFSTRHTLVYMYAEPHATRYTDILDFWKDILTQIQPKHWVLKTSLSNRMLCCTQWIANGLVQYGPVRTRLVHGLAWSGSAFIFIWYMW